MIVNEVLPTSVRNASAPLVWPLSWMVYLNEAVPLKSSVGVNSIWPLTMATVPPTASLTAVMVRVCVDSLAGPLLSLPNKEAKLMVRTPLSSATLESVSSNATGASLTSVTITETVVGPLMAVPSEML